MSINNNNNNNNNDRKRSLENSTESINKKLKPLDELSENGPLTQADVIYFKKEAIWRQMIQYKQQVLKLKVEIKKLTKDSEFSKYLLNVLIAWYDEILLLFNLSSSNEGNDNILVSFEDYGNNKIEEKLVQLKTNLSKAISSKINENLDISSLKEFTYLKSQNEILANDKKILSQTIENLQSEILDLIDKRERNESITLKRVDDSRKEIKEEKVEEEIKQEVKEDEESKSTSENNNNNNNGNSSINIEELENLNNEIDQLKSTIQILNEQINKLTESNQLYLQKSENLDNKLHNLEESDLQDNLNYKKIIKNNQLLQEQISKVNKLNTINITKLTELEKKQTEIKKFLENEIQEENEKLKQQLAKNEEDLVRIRTTRDELLAKNTILSTQIEDQKTNQSLIELNKTYSKRIEELESLKEQQQLPSSSSSSTTNNDNQQIQLLQNEIKELELAFKQTRDLTLKKLNSTIDQDNVIKKLTIEKTKADQKYFASMRLKDSLTNENKILKQQITKSQEIIKNLNELEINYLNKIEVLNNSLIDYKIIKENSLQENFNLQDSIRNLKQSKESLDNEINRINQKNEIFINEIIEIKNLNNKQEIEINQLKKKLIISETTLTKYKSNNTNLLLQEDEQQLEALRSIAKCSVCTKNWKDTAITVCGHVFCSNCTQERLAARLRRCPSCNKGFSSNDLLTIHL
ncbi:BRE1 [Candida jiufengensis]|uniref:BRE1 n=1 Tax=Candida jiufengensis TaxID=497108 RepID=UPI002224F011|nr:BRE1 [Candida jiufengensis]KAI5956604.1 BRE1 [Candida jiufengensis]